MEKLPSAENLRLQAKRNGTENDVRINQRKLVDKILARYSSDFVVFRELIQNADDARATCFNLSICCHRTKSSDPSSEEEFHNCPITELRASNNGQSFSEVDWDRVAAIADGNVDVESIGQFGVGFFSVFSYSDGPIITSGKDYLVFAWRDEQVLTTYRQRLPIGYQSEWTSIIMTMRQQFLLHTKPATDENGKVTKMKVATNQKSMARMDKIIPIIDLQEVKMFFARSNATFCHFT